MRLDEIDRKIIAATEAGLPVTSTPFDDLSLLLNEEGLLITSEEVMTRFNRLLQSGAVRRIAAVPNHYRVGFTANAMTVWDVPDELVSELGKQIGSLDFVSHCYKRPRHLPMWPYNLFAMVHGKTRLEAEQKAEKIKQLLGDNCRSYSLLFSKRILKKTGFRSKKTEVVNV